LNTGKRDFDKEASTWDAPPRIKLAQDVSKAILGRLHLTQDMDILDFGCGTGLVSLHHVKEIQPLLEQFYRTLLPGGRMAIADLDEEGGRFHGNNNGVFHFGFDRWHHR